MARFHKLTVTDLQRTTRDAVVVTLAPPPGDAPDFSFTQGQYLTFRRSFDGEELRRSYSICSPLGGPLRVAIKRVEGGVFSAWANAALKPGDVLDAMAPAGSFHAPLDPGARRSYLCFAGGSGITPVLSVVETALAEEPGSEVTLVYANRSVASIMFREELEDLKNRHMGRLTLIHVLEDDAQEIDLFTGRLDAAKCARLFAHWIDVAATDLAFICGPEPMMLTVAKALKDHGLSESQIKFELFASPRPAGSAPPPPETAKAQTGTALVTLDGARREVAIAPGQSVLEAALAASLDAPFACKAGVCSTCRAKVLEGEVEMRANHALEDYEVARGYVLTCQSYPVSGRVVVDYDQ